MNAYQRNKMRKLLIFSILSLLPLLTLTGCSSVPPGHVGVIVNPLGEEKGVQNKQLDVGIHFRAPWKTVYLFPIFEQNVTWVAKSESDYAFTFQTCEGMAVGADIGITFNLKPDAIPLIFQKYRSGIREITDIFVKNYVRDAINRAASKIKIEDLYGPGKEAFFQDVEDSIRSDLSPIGINLSKIYLIGRFGFPSNVIVALNAKIEATQRAEQRENELREAEAQAKKEIAKTDGNAKCMYIEAEAQARSSLIKAESEAKANKLLAESITKELVDWQGVQKWDGKLPQVSGQTTPFINLR
jgi:regulator of protease activity HflC (stomatin/prohibitin superfamily)